MAPSVVVRRLENITECGLCTGDLTDARLLPCVHTFCLKCIDQWSQDRVSAQENVSCPTCRKLFTISEGGVAALPKNCFVEKLLDVKKVSFTLSQGETVCDVCSDEEQSDVEMKKATVYCVDCRRNMCEQCRGFHQKFRLPGVHRLIDLNSEMSVDELMLKFPENVCDKHPDKSLEIFCFDCSVAVCMMCYIRSHNSHKCSDIKEVAEELSEQMSVNAESLTSKVSECDLVLKNIEERENVFCDSVAAAETLICERAEKMKQLIDDHKQSLLEQLTESTDRQLKQTATVREEIERHQIVVENFIRYCSEVKERGTACDIAKLAGHLNARSKELQQFDMGTDLSVYYDVTEVEFTSPQTDEDVKQAFGNLAIDVQDYFKLSADVFHVIPSTHSAVTGIAVLNDQIYVSRWGTAQIAVYCPDTFQQLRVLSCTNARQHHGYGSQIRNMTACNTNNCLYASDQYTHYIYRVDGDNNYSSSRWSDGGNPQGLSITLSHNVLAALQDDNTLCEYSTSGEMIREISLQPAGITTPVYAVQLTDQQYAVAHHGPKHQLSIVNTEGQLVKSYRGDQGHLNAPRGIAVDRRGRVMVADQYNNRILVINPDTMSAYPLALRDCELNVPFSLHYDTANRRLYIGEWKGGRVICCKL